MTVTGVSQGTTQTTTTASASTSLNQTFDNFLTLLTTQLRYQDPISPMDTNEFTSQLVQFSEVEQSIAQTKKLEDLIALQAANQIGFAASLTGKEVEVLGNQGALEDDRPIEFGYKTPADAATIVLNIRDSKGKIVFTKEGDKTAGEHDFVWDGKTTDGAAAPDGTYTFEVVAKDAAGTQLPVKTSVVGRVDEVDLTGGEINLGVNGVPVSLLDVVVIRDRAA